VSHLSHCWQDSLLVLTTVLLQAPTGLPTVAPTLTPTIAPSQSPSTTPTGIPTRAPTLWPSQGPSLSPSRSPTALPSQLPTTSPTFSPTSAILYPVIIINSQRSTATTVTVNMRLTRAGYVYCGAYTSGDTTPSGSAIKAATYPVTVQDSGSSVLTANVTVTGLTALSQYFVYCFSEDFSTPANVLPSSLVAATRTPVNTTCCHSLRLPDLPGNLYEMAISSALSVTAPVGGLVVLLNATYCPGITKAACTSSNSQMFGPANCSGAANLTISPASTLRFSTAGSRTFSIFAGSGGCYRLNYTVTGASRGRVSTPSFGVMYVLYQGEARSGPKLSSAQLSNTGSQVNMAFEYDTDMGSLFGLFPCSRVVNFTGAATTR
jgi:hypothetical protein